MTTARCPSCAAELDLVELEAEALEPVLGRPVLDIVMAAAAQHGVRPSLVVSRSRLRSVQAARVVAMATTLEAFGFCLEDVGALFDRHHTTVLHARRTAPRHLVEQILVDLGYREVAA